jgi:hypothetical protein
MVVVDVKADAMHGTSGGVVAGHEIGICMLTYLLPLYLRNSHSEALNELFCTADAIRYIPNASQLAGHRSPF